MAVAEVEEVDPHFGRDWRTGRGGKQAGIVDRTRTLRAGTTAEKVINFFFGQELRGIKGTTIYEPSFTATEILFYRFGIMSSK